jgi:pilus assembly protein CpaC
VAVKFFISIFIAWISCANLGAQTPPAAPTSAVVEKELEVAVGLDALEKVDFDYSPKIYMSNEQVLKLSLVPQKREIIFKGQKPGKVIVRIRDAASGEVRLVYNVMITATGKSNTVSELKELIGDVEGLEIGIKGGKVFVGGEIVIPDDIGRVSKVLASYPDVLTLIELSPQTQIMIARKMTDELARSNLKDVTVRVVNKNFWLEGVVSSESKRELAETIAKAYLPPQIRSLSKDDTRFAAPPDVAPITNFIAVNEKKDPQPAPKMVKITTQFVELSKSYNKIFAFKWAPLMGSDESQITIGQTASGNVTTKSSGTLSATISNLFPKLNSAQTAGYARIIQSGMIITRDTKPGNISKRTVIPFAVGSGEFTKATSADVGLKMDVTPKILEQEKVEIAANISIALSVSTGSTPITTNNDLSTNVVIKSKESAAIGGVVQNQSNTDFNNEPSSSALVNGQPANPLFRLYRSKNYVTNKTQYVIFITPEIIESASVGTEEIRKKFRRRE